MSVRPRQARIGVLVIDDSAVNRHAISRLLEDADDVEVLGRAADGEEGLRKALELRPDVITLDLEMPRMDGYAFLRVLKATAPTPVIVVSSYAHPSDVFKALELGAFDFIAKPDRRSVGELESIRALLLEKIRAAPMVRRERLRAPAERAPPVVLPIVVVGASTGGPPAIQRLLEGLGGENVCVLVAQHMPPRFTAAFAERLDRSSPFRVAEAQGGDRVVSGRVFVAPGGRHLLVESRAAAPVLRVVDAAKDDAYVPSVDRLFSSVATVVGRRAIGVVLTGMGDDGRAGALALRKAGAVVVAEAEETATIFGMPKEAIEAGAVQQVLRLDQIAPFVRRVLAKG